MDRFPVWIAPSLAIIALGMILAQWRSPPQSTSPASLEPAPALEPVAAAAEMMELRKRHGSVLAGSALESVAQPSGEFQAALANYLGEEIPGETAAPLVASPAVKLVDQLRSTARALELQADEFETAERYTDADELRALAGKLREQARKWIAHPL